MIVGDRTFAKLTFTDTAHSTMNAAGASATNVRYRPTAAFDVDPIVGSTSTPGFAEWAAFYRYYRVHAFAYKVQFTNADTESMTVYCLPMNTDPLPNAAFSTASQFVCQPYAKVKQVSGAGGMDRAFISGYVNCKKLVGSKTFNYDDNYSSIVNTIPTNNIYLAVGALSQRVAMTNGMNFWFRVTMYVEFYERVPLTS